MDGLCSMQHVCDMRNTNNFFSGNLKGKERVRTVDGHIKEIGCEGVDCTNDRLL